MVCAARSSLGGRKLSLHHKNQEAFGWETACWLLPDPAEDTQRIMSSAHKRLLLLVSVAFQHPASSQGVEGTFRIVSVERYMENFTVAAAERKD